MYERFTDRARKVMMLANQEAQRLNHEYMGTEHILLGLIKEGTGIAASVLTTLEIDLRKVRIEVEKIVQAGPEMVTMGKLPLTPRAQKSLEYAIAEARGLEHNYVGTEHILLGLIAGGEGVAPQVLMNLGLSYIQIRDSIVELLKSNNPRQEMKESVVVPLDAGRVPEQVTIQPPRPVPFTEEGVLCLVHEVRKANEHLNAVAAALTEANRIIFDLQQQVNHATQQRHVAQSRLVQYIDSAGK